MLYSVIQIFSILQRHFVLFVHFFLEFYVRMINVYLSPLFLHSFSFDIIHIFDNLLICETFPPFGVNFLEIWRIEFFQKEGNCILFDFFVGDQEDSFTVCDEILNGCYFLSPNNFLMDLLSDTTSMHIQFSFLHISAHFIDDYNIPSKQSISFKSHHFSTHPRSSLLSPFQKYKTDGRLICIRLFDIIT